MGDGVVDGTAVMPLLRIRTHATKCAGYLGILCQLPYEMKRLANRTLVSKRVDGPSPTFGTPSETVDKGNKVLCLLSYKTEVLTGLEPVTSPLTVEVTLIFTPGA
jgi:hypothetical protein